MGCLGARWLAQICTTAATSVSGITTTTTTGVASQLAVTISNGLRMTFQFMLKVRVGMRDVLYFADVAAGWMENVDLAGSVCTD